MPWRSSAKNDKTKKKFVSLSIRKGTNWSTLPSDTFTYILAANGT
jgi:hypothetical protein